MRFNGVALVPNMAAPLGVLHTLATLAGQAISSEPVPQTCSKKNLYLLRDNFQTTQAVSGLAISSGSTGGSWPCSAAEVTLCGVVLQRWEIRRIDVTLRVAFGDAVIGVRAVNSDGHRAWIRSPGEYAQYGSAIAVSGSGIMTVTASQVIVDRQVGMEHLEFSESLDLMEGIKGSGFRRSQGLRLQTCFFGDDAEEVGVIFDEAL